MSSPPLIPRNTLQRFAIRSAFCRFRICSIAHRIYPLRDTGFVFSSFVLHILIMVVWLLTSHREIRLRRTMPNIMAAVPGVRGLQPILHLHFQGRFALAL